MPITCHDQHEACLGWWAENRRRTIFGKGLGFFGLRLVQRKNAVANFTSQPGVVLGEVGWILFVVDLQGHLGTQVVAVYQLVDISCKQLEVEVA